MPVITKEKYVIIYDAIGLLESYDESAEITIPETAFNNPYIKYLYGSINLEELYKSYS
jgi:hypothetical protein